MKNRLQKNVFHILQFIVSARFMASSLSNLANNLFEGIHKMKCKYGHNNKCRIKYKYCGFFLEWTIFKDDLVEDKCLCCSKNCQRKFDEKLKERLFNTCKFSDHNNSKFCCCEKVFILMIYGWLGKIQRNIVT